MAEMNFEELYERAHKLKGLGPQLDITLEECAELIQAIIKYRRSHDKYDIEVVKEHLAEEVADVEIMIEQLRVSFGNEFDKLVAIYKAQKLNRLRKRLDILDDEFIKSLDSTLKEMDGKG